MSAPRRAPEGSSLRSARWVVGTCSVPHQGDEILMASAAPASRQHAIGTGPAVGAGSNDPKYKWIALSNTTIGVLMAAINASIVLIALPEIFRDIKMNPLLASNTASSDGARLVACGRDHRWGGARPGVQHRAWRSTRTPSGCAWMALSRLESLGPMAHDHLDDATSRTLETRERPGPRRVRPSTAPR